MIRLIYYFIHIIIKHCNGSNRDCNILVTHVDVKKRLQDFVLNKKQREQAVASLTNDSAFKHW